MVMRKFRLFLIIILLAPATVCFAQEASQSASKIGWTEVYDEKVNYSVSFPPNFLVDNEAQKDFLLAPVLFSFPDLFDTIEKPDIISYQKSVSMFLSVYDLRLTRAKDHLHLFTRSYSDKPYQDFRLGDFTGRKITFDDDKTLGTYIVAAVKNKIIIISAFAEEEDFEIYERFLMSIKINGKTFLKSDSKTEYAGKNDRLSIDELKTSPEISDALNQKNKKRDFSSNQIQIYPENKENDKEKIKVSRPVIILRQPRKSLFSETTKNFRGILKVRVSFQDDGKIGDVIFLSDAPNFLLKSVFAEIQEIKFLPAELEGKKINFTKLMEYHFNVK